MIEALEKEYLEILGDREVTTLQEDLEVLKMAMKALEIKVFKHLNR